MLMNNNDSKIENDSLFFDADNNTITFKKNEIVITLTELQSRLIFLLLSGVTKKREIIKLVWQDNHISITDNNYHQLVYQCRSLFNRHGIPSFVLKTIPRHGIRFNYSALENNEKIINPPSKKIEGISKIVAVIKSKKAHWTLLLLVMSSFSIPLFLDVTSMLAFLTYPNH